MKTEQTISKTERVSNADKEDRKFDISVNATFKDGKATELESGVVRTREGNATVANFSRKEYSGATLDVNYASDVQPAESSAELFEFIDEINQYAATL